MSAFSRSLMICIGAGCFGFVVVQIVSSALLEWKPILVDFNAFHEGLLELVLILLCLALYIVNWPDIIKWALEMEELK